MKEFINEMKKAGIWDKLDSLYIYNGTMDPLMNWAELLRKNVYDELIKLDNDIESFDTTNPEWKITGQWNCNLLTDLLSNEWKQEYIDKLK